MVREMKKSILILVVIAVIISIFIIGTASSVKPEHEDVIIGFYKTPGPSENALIHNNNGKIKHNFHLVPAVSASLPEKAINKLKKNPKIAFIEYDIMFMATADEYANSWGVQHIGSEIVHNSSINGSGVKIAILDTGIDYYHEDLDDNYKGGYDFVFNDPDPFDDSWNGHGTHMAGIAAAENNGIGVVGVAPEADIYAVKVLDGSGFGLASWVIAGIEWAVENDMDIITMSFGSGPDDPDLESLKLACDNAYNSGVLLVASAGNTLGGDVLYPARLDSVIAVTATNESDQYASFSPIDPEVELAAPGVDINSTISSMASLPTTEKYWHMSGTSMASPHVAGTAALIMSSGSRDVNGNWSLNNTDVRMQLKMTAIDLGLPGQDDIYGFGLVDAKAAVINGTSVMTEEDCRSCHNDSPDFNGTLVGRHHLLMQTNDYGCPDCHEMKWDNTTLSYHPEVIRDCLVCHLNQNQTNTHYLQGEAGLV
jgi:subtilisin